MNLADMLENHELRRCSGLPLGLFCFSIEADRERRLEDAPPLAPDLGSALPLASPLLVGSIADGEEVVFEEGICRGCAGAGTLGGEDDLWFILSVGEQHVSHCSSGRNEWHGHLDCGIWTGAVCWAKLGAVGGNATYPWETPASSN